VLIQFVLCVVCSLSQVEPRTDRDDLGGWTWKLASGWQWVVSPASDLYRGYIADPRRPEFALMLMSFDDSEIPDAGQDRFGFRLGGGYGFLRWCRQDNPDYGWQFNVEGAFLGYFDRERSTDNIGWDGLYGLGIAFRPGGRSSYRLAILHDSAHVGDELAESSGRRRFNYTRQEYALGVSYRIRRTWRVYAEGAYAYDLRNEDIQMPGRFAAGLERDSPSRGWYLALHNISWEEMDWDWEHTAQAGLVLPFPGLARTYRIGAEWHHGRSVLGEFSIHDETYFALGFWFEL